MRFDSLHEPVYRGDLAELGMVDAEPEQAFDNLTALASHLLQTQVSLVSIVQPEKNRQYFKSQVGLPEPWATRRETPLSHSFCQYVRASEAPLVVNDARTHDLVKSNLAIRDLGVIAYLGVPIHGPNREAIGALCVVQGEPRQWLDHDIAMLEKLADCVSDQILLRASLRHSEDLRRSLRKQHAKTRRYHVLTERITLAFNTPDIPVAERFNLLLEAGCEALGTDLGTINEISANGAAVSYAAGHATKGAGWPEGTDTNTIGELALRAGTTQIAPRFDATQDPRMTDALGRRPGCYMGIPLISGTTTFGTMTFTSMDQKAVPWEEEDLALASMIGLVAASNLQLQFELTVAKWST